MPSINYLAVVVTAVAIFMLGGLWYSVLFTKLWIALQGQTEEQMRARGANPMMFVQVFICGLLTAFVMALLLSHFPDRGLHLGIMAGFFTWLGFAGATSYGTALFSYKPKALWAIDSGFNLVSFLIAGVILSLWR